MWANLIAHINVDYGFWNTHYLAHHLHNVDTNKRPHAFDIVMPLYI